MQKSCMVTQQDFSEESVTEKWFSYFSTKTYVVGTQKNRPNETVLLSTQNICYKLWVRRYWQFYSENFFFILTCDTVSYCLTKIYGFAGNG